VPELIQPPPDLHERQDRYRLTARPKRTFQTFLSAEDIIDVQGTRAAVISSRRQGDEVTLGFEFPLARGQIDETLTLDLLEGRLRCRRLVRSVSNGTGERVRLEETLFRDRTFPLPESAYPEVALPFLLAWQPMDGRTRDLYAWINDRFVARVEYQSQGEVDLALPSGTRKAIKKIMYPDFNDWIPLGKVLSRMARPFVPKYHMWFSLEAPHTVLRFEGPYGPPGAPEIVLEWLPPC